VRSSVLRWIAEVKQYAGEVLDVRLQDRNSDGGDAICHAALCCCDGAGSSSALSGRRTRPAAPSGDGSSDSGEQQPRPWRWKPGSRGLETSDVGRNNDGAHRPARGPSSLVVFVAVDCLRRLLLRRLISTPLN